MALEVLLKAGLGKLGERIVGAVPGLGTAIAGTMLLKEVVDKHASEVCVKARETVQCNCIKVCPQVWGPRTASMLEWIAEHKGMTFVFEGIALCHEQPDFDVKKLSTDVLRWDGKFISRGGDMNIQPCKICSQKKDFKISEE
jgi:hypothetical protein